MKEHFHNVLEQILIYFIPFTGFGLLYLLYVLVVRKKGSSSHIARILKVLLDRNKDGKVDVKDAVKFIDHIDDLSDIDTEQIPGKEED